MDKSKQYLIIGGVFLVLVGILWYWNNNPGGNQARPAGYQGEMIEFKPEVTVEITNDKIKPNKIYIKEGDTILVKVEAKEGSHNFVIDELGVSSSVLSEGSWEMLPIVAPNDSAGKEYKFYSNIGPDEANEIGGTLIVK